MTTDIYGINIAPLRGAGMGIYVSQGSRRYYVAWSPWAIVITFASQRLYEVLLVAWSPWAIAITFASQRLHRLLLQNIKSVRNLL